MSEGRCIVCTRNRFRGCLGMFSAALSAMVAQAQLRARAVCVWVDMRGERTAEERRGTGVMNGAPQIGTGWSAYIANTLTKVANAGP